VAAQLSHVAPKGRQDAYNHAEHVEQRRRMMQDWADRLDLLEQGDVEAARVPARDAPVKLQPPKEAEAVSNVVNVETGTTVTITISTGQAPNRTQRDALMTTSPSTKVSDSEQLSLYEAPGNLPLSMFASLAEKPEERILQDIHVGRLLAIHLDDRGYRIPDWQLDPTKYLLTLVVLAHAKEADMWAIYRALSAPTVRLADRSPVEIVTAGTILDVGEMVCELLMGP